MNVRLSLQQLESYLWGAAVILRGLVDAGDYKQFIFPLVFYKRRSDVWDEDYAAALATCDSDAELARAEADERFLIPEGAHWANVRQLPKDIGRALQTAMRAIEAANPGRFDGIFGDTPWTNKERLPDHTLKNLLEHFSTLTLSIANVPEDTLGDAYEYLIGRFADDGGHTAQEFYTNRTVVHLMTQMVEPQAGERIYDPTCGTGGMLIAALAEVKRSGGEHRTLGLFGQERSHMTASIARMNLVLHGVEDFHVARGDTLDAPHFTYRDRLATFSSIRRWRPVSSSAARRSRPSARAACSSSTRSTRSPASAPTASSSPSISAASPPPTTPLPTSLASAASPTWNASPPTGTASRSHSTSSVRERRPASRRISARCARSGTTGSKTAASFGSGWMRWSTPWTR